MSWFSITAASLRKDRRAKSRTIQKSSGPISGREGNSVLELRDVVCRYGEVTVLKGISLKVGKGQLVTLIGTNGAGKSTTLKTISGLLKPVSGTILFEGHDITDASPRRILELGIAHCPEGRRVFPF